VVAAPGTPIEDAGQSGEQDVAPVEECRAFIEVGEAEEDCGDQKSSRAAHAALEEVLYPAAEEDLFRKSDADEGADPDGDGEPGVLHAVVEVQEAEGESEWNRDGHVEEHLAKAGGPVAAAKAEVVADGGQAADGEEGIEAGVEKGELAEQGEPRGPGGFEPAEIDGEAEGQENEEVEEVAALAGVEVGGEKFNGGEEDGNEKVEEKPARGEDIRTVRNDDVRDDEEGWNRKAKEDRKRLCEAGAAVAGESEGEERDEEQSERDDGRKNGKGGGHGLSDSW